MVNNKEILQSYINKGFNLILLHGVSNKGICCCSKGAQCKYTGKHPIYNSWQNRNETIDTISNHPTANIGIATGKRSGILVMDIDPRNGGHKSLSKLISEHGELPETLTVSTGGGGTHYYFSYPVGAVIKNHNSLLPGIDIKSDGGYVVTPPSLHASGKQYLWQSGKSPIETKLAEVPEWLMSLIIDSRKTTTSKVEKLPEIISEGMRNITLTSLAGTLRKRGVSFEGILATLRVENERCSPPLEDSDLITIAKSISRYEPAPTVLDWSPETKENLNTIISSLTDYSKVFEADILSLLSLASRYDPASYATIKAKLKGKVNLNDLERAIKHQGRLSSYNITTDFNRVLDLEELEARNLLIPNGWQISITNGVTKSVSDRNGGEREITACFTPVIISRRFHNLDTGFEKIELSFYRDGYWKTILAPRSIVFNRNGILRLADNSFPVTSNNAGDLISYLTDFEHINNAYIPVIQSVSRLGWLKNGDFFPFSKKADLEFESDSKEAQNIINGLTCSGDGTKWLAIARKARENPAVRFILSASFASVLLDPLHKRVFFVHLWHNSRSGKTATLKLAISAWGNPYKIIGSFNSTIVGLERMASSLRNLPFGIDELQVLNSKRISIENIIYMLSQGQGRTRGGKDGGLQETLTWKNIILTTGEEAILGSNTQDGANTRTFEIYAKPMEDNTLGITLHEVSEQHYGHAGKVFIERLCGDLKKNLKFLQELFETIKPKLFEKFQQSIHIDEVTTVCLGDYLSSIYVFREEDAAAMTGAIDTALAMLENNRQLTQNDNIERAWEMFSGWLIANSSRFGFDAPTPQYGRTDENGKYLVIPAYAHKALEDAGFSPKKVFRGFAERGYIESKLDSDGIKRFQLGRNIMGKICRVYVVSLPEDKSQDIEPLL